MNPSITTKAINPLFVCIGYLLTSAMISHVINIHSLCVSQNHSGMRLDLFLSNQIDQLSRTYLKNIIEEGLVKVSDVTVIEPDFRVKMGQLVEVTVPAPKPVEHRAQNIELKIYYEDDDVLVVEKQAGLVVHPSPGHPDSTLVNALISHCGSSLSGIGGVSRPGIVHRLDKDTSGLMIVAKNDKSHQFLARQFSEHSMERAYLAVVWGIVSPSRGKISGNIGRSSRNRKKMAVVKKNGKRAITNYKLVKKLEKCASLIECRLSTGRTHQIRVHMADLGFPIVSDAIYGRKKNNPAKKEFEKFYKRAAEISRQALHAYLIGFEHPRTRQKMIFKSDLPPDMKKLIG